jgi:hypothetical protein
MNRDPAKVEKVRVSLATDRGARRDCVLEESAADSGLFLGRCRTVLGLGEEAAEALPCFEGETLQAVYIDQMRRDGPAVVNLCAEAGISARVFSASR